MYLEPDTDTDTDTDTEPDTTPHSGVINTNRNIVKPANILILSAGLDINALLDCCQIDSPEKVIVVADIKLPDSEVLHHRSQAIHGTGLAPIIPIAAKDTNTINFLKKSISNYLCNGNPFAALDGELPTLIILHPSILAHLNIPANTLIRLLHETINLEVPEVKRADHPAIFSYPDIRSLVLLAAFLENTQNSSQTEQTENLTTTSPFSELRRFAQLAIRCSKAFWFKCAAEKATKSTQPGNKVLNFLSPTRPPKNLQSFVKLPLKMAS